ncbi:amidase [Pseudonocardia nigra]|uniref:amidase n=1 Tax=Pseudonocardia nigra TaxID=1921578 RepID=UPI001C5D0B7A|nr:amidase [Pseudonocardia nigra]
MTELAALDAVAQADLVRRGELTAEELVAAAIERIEALDPVLNAVVTPMFEHAQGAARRAPAGPFRGVPFLVKDLLVDVAGVRMTAGSRFLRDTVSVHDSELVVRLRRAGLVIVGKTNTPEFGMVPACEPVRHGPTRNPWDVTRSTSGSSGGSAAAVASGMVPMAHANDLGGSIRFPAAATGLLGLKPTRARNPLGPGCGYVVSGWLTEHAVTRSVRDSAVLLDATAGPTPGDPYPAPPPARPFAAEVGADPGRLRIAFTSRTPDGSPGDPDCVDALDDAVALCSSLGHEMLEANLPGLTPAVGAAIGTVFHAATAWTVGHWVRRLGREPGPDELEPLTQAYREAGERVSAAEYLLAIGELQAFARGVAAFLTDVDLWLTPTTSSPPPPLGEIVSTPDDPMRALRRGGPTVRYPAVVANLTGNPAMSVPLWWNDAGLPVGVHFLGRFGDEATLLRLAAQLEQARPWAERTPAVSAFTAAAISESRA